MGLFASRPEEPSEWAGIPSEPRDAGSPSERLEQPVSAGIDGLFADERVQSIVVPLPQPADPTQPGDAAQSAGPADED